MSNWLTKLFKPKTKSQTFNEAVSMVGYEPNFTSFGKQVNYSDIVYSALKMKARFFGKCDPKHIRYNNNTKIIINDSYIAKALRNPNQYQTTFDFLTQAFFMREINDTCYILHDYDRTNGGGVATKGLYILIPMQKPRTIENEQGLQWAFTFGGYDGEVIFPYNDIICWKKDIEDNLYMGGGKYNSNTNTDLLNSLEAYHQIKQSIAEASKLGCMFDGIIKVAAYGGDQEKIKAIRDKFIGDMKANKGGIGVLDNGADYQSVQRQLKMVDASTMQEIKENILIHTGVSIEMLTGNFTIQQKEAFYENWIEPAAISLAQAMTKVFFTQKQMSFGDAIELYPHKVQLMATSEIVSIIQSTIPAGVFTIDEYREMLGYAPLGTEEGQQRPRGYNNLDGSQEQPKEAEDGELSSQETIDVIKDVETIAKEPLLVGQIQALTQIIADYQAGAYTYNQALNMLCIGVGLSEEDAKKLLDKQDIEAEEAQNG